MPIHISSGIQADTTALTDGNIIVDNNIHRDGYHRNGSVMAELLRVPGRPCVWDVSSRLSDAVPDLSGARCHMTPNNSPTFGGAGRASYVDLDGTDQYLSRDNTAGERVNITGAVTVGGWFWTDTLAYGTTDRGFIGKWNATGDQRSYLVLFNDSSNKAEFSVSRLGTNATVTTISGPVLVASTWYFIVGRFTPSTNVEIYVNGTWYSGGSGPASIYDCSGDFNIGAFDNGTATTVLNGRANLLLATPAALSNSAVTRLYQRTRGLRGV